MSSQKTRSLIATRLCIASGTKSVHQQRHPSQLIKVMWKVTLEYIATILMSWVRPGREILRRPSTHTPAKAQLYESCYGCNQLEAR